MQADAAEFDLQTEGSNSQRVLATTTQHYLEAEGSPGEYPTNLCEHIVNEVARALVTSCFIIIGVIQEHEIRLALYVAKATRNTSLLPYPTC